ncbi:DUF2948 family protein [Candidatus Halocynthiibacter alkanivorans]|jgi:Protein of unknown function (DUF2948)|uniref:DUF2948 family protein n=1 Tax=Candidatus Halocynthiibacter alkanivorans TaxID=2267619 RepID=UPI000DF18616|nr:DUF2948 family protein [Candidatus Halocynthiibacter alkanivorans]
MSEDAKFEDGGERPLFLKALDAEDLQVLSALVQDAVLPMGEIRYDRSQRQFALLLNRFRWEDVPQAERRKRDFERVQSVLAIGDVMKVATSGIDPADKDLVLSLLSVSFEPGEDGTGRVELTLAGDGAIALDVEAIDLTLKDVTRPYVAPSRHLPKHEG